MSQIRGLRFIQKRFNSQKSWELEGTKHQRYHWGYAPFSYYVQWNGPTALTQNLDNKKDKISELETGWAQHNHLDKISDVCEMFANYDEESYRKTKKMIANDFSTVRTEQPISISESNETNDYFDWSQYRTEFHPWFKSWLFRTLTYIVQGVESNIELAAEKMYFREVQEQFHITKYKLPGDHLMSAKQAEENLAQYYSDIQLKAEMPPICVARPDIKTEISHKSKMFEKLDGSDFVLTDVSPARPHENRPMLLREKVTGKLKYADWDRRDRLLQLYYPTKFRSQELPHYIDVSRDDFDEIVDNFIANHGWKGSMQIMEAAVSYFDLNDSRYVKLRNKLNLKLIQNGEFDHFYATRHGGQFIFYILENGHVEKYLEFLISNRSGAKRVQELRTILLMLDLVKLNSCDLLALTKESVKEKLDDIFMKKHFSSKELEELQKTEGLKLLSKVVDYDDRYLLNLLPDYSKFLKR